MGKPPRPSKKQKLKELLNDGAILDSSMPVTPAGRYLDRPPSWDQAPQRYRATAKSHPIELWRYLTARMLEEHNNNPLNLRNISRSNILCLKWAKLAKLLVRANQQGYLHLTSTKAMIGQLKSSQKKVSSLQIQGRWNKLINGVLHSVQYRWVRLIKGLINRGHLNSTASIYTMSRKAMMGGPSKTEKLSIIGRWSRLINGIKNKQRKRSKHTSLLLCGRWARMARKIVAKDNKLRSLDVNGRWRILASKLLNKSKPPNTVDERWKRLVRAGQRHGYIKKKPLDWKLLLISKGQKPKSMMNRRERSMYLCTKWNQLARRIIQKNVERKVML
jgi:hypothetical protein